MSENAAVGVGVEVAVEVEVGVGVEVEVEVGVAVGIEVGVGVEVGVRGRLGNDEGRGRDVSMLGKRPGKIGSHPVIKFIQVKRRRRDDDISDNISRIKAGRTRRSCAR